VFVAEEKESRTGEGLQRSRMRQPSVHENRSNPREEMVGDEEMVE